jgi:hypothetical protein
MAGGVRSLWANHTGAVIGFAAAVVAVVVAGLITYLDKHNERAANKRTAIRLVVTEVRSDLDALDWFMYTGRKPRTPITTEAWHTQQEALARYLTGWQWTNLSGFYYQLERIKPIIQSSRCVPRPERSQVTTALVEGTNALKALDNTFLSSGGTSSRLSCSVSSRVAP